MSTPAVATGTERIYDGETVEVTVLGDIVSELSVLDPILGNYSLPSDVRRRFLQDSFGLHMGSKGSPVWLSLLTAKQRPLQAAALIGRHAPDTVSPISQPPTSAPNSSRVLRSPTAQTDSK